MNRLASSSLSLVLSLGVAGAAAPLATAQQETGSHGSITVQSLMQSLANYGVWMAHPQLGWVWQPHDVQPWWQPFSVGEWVVTQDGSPYWNSSLPFGWAVEHYGAWTYDDSRGWLWVPGNEWSPAPVSWRGRDGVVGGRRNGDRQQGAGVGCPLAVAVAADQKDRLVAVRRADDGACGRGRTGVTARTSAPLRRRRAPGREGGPASASARPAAPETN